MNPAKLAGYCLCLGLETPNQVCVLISGTLDIFTLNNSLVIPPQPPPTLPAVLTTAPPAALASALAEENLKNPVSQSKEFCDSSGREVAELDLKQGKAGKGPAANVLVLNLVARFDFVGIRDFSQKNKSRSLKGLPISLRTRRQLEKLPPASLKLLQVQFFLLTP